MTAGRLALLDGINRMPTGAISALLRLIEDREITLFDGSRYVKPERYQVMQHELGLSEAMLEQKGIFCVHPSFRILALATPPSRGQVRHNVCNMQRQFGSLYTFFLVQGQDAMLPVPVVQWLD